MAGGESALVAWLARTFGRGLPSAVRVGIGDDAAVLAPATLPWVWTVDVQVEGTHFERDWLSFVDLGARALHAAVSDLAAMGATPIAALSSLVVPAELGASAIRGIARGQKRAAVALACPIVGGNLARGRELSVTTTAVGTCRRPLLREGARAGDELWLVGDVGLAAAGLSLLSRPPRGGRGRRLALSGPDARAVRACTDALKRPRALVARGRALVGRARSAVDVSDGLAGDLGHLASASRVRGVVEEAALRRCIRPELTRVSALVGRTALDLALFGGEDYALVATGPAAARPRWARRIGRVEQGRGVYLETTDGLRRALGKGFDHFG